MLWFPLTAGHPCVCSPDRYVEGIGGSESPTVGTLLEMKTYAQLLSALALMACTASSAVGAEAAKDESPLKTDQDKASYAIGMDIGRAFRKQKLEVNLDVLFQGLKDSFAGGKMALTDEQAKDALAALQKLMATRAETEAKEAGEKNAKTGQAFLDANKKKDGVKVTASGLQYKVITQGTGPVPKATDTVKTHYRGTLIDGTEFDSSYKRNEPATFPVNGVIPGCTEALQLMPVGSKWQLFIPGTLAYGERGGPPGSGIEPDATLLFDIELLSIESGKN